MEPKYLTLKEELEIVKSLNENSLLGAGSSRAVYKYGEDRVIKLAISQEGVNQNDLELQRFIQYGASSFANIYAAGQYVLVSEYTRVLDAEYILDCFNDNEAREDDGEERKDYDNPDIELYGSQVRDLKDWLDDLSGFTDDNYQLGVGFDGRLVAYDYGYSPDAGNDVQVAHMREWVEEDNFLSIAYQIISECGVNSVGRFNVDGYFPDFVTDERPDDYNYNNSDYRTCSGDAEEQPTTTNNLDLARPAAVEFPF